MYRDCITWRVYGFYYTKSRFSGILISACEGKSFPFPHTHPPLVSSISQSTFPRSRFFIYLFRIHDLPGAFRPRGARQGLSTPTRPPSVLYRRPPPEPPCVIAFPRPRWWPQTDPPSWSPDHCVEVTSCVTSRVFCGNAQKNSPISTKKIFTIFERKKSDNLCFSLCPYSRHSNSTISVSKYRFQKILRTILGRFLSPPRSCHPPPGS